MGYHLRIGEFAVDCDTDKEAVSFIENWNERHPDEPVPNPENWIAKLASEPEHADAHRLPVHRQRAASYLRQRCGAVKISYLATACDIPKGSIARVLKYPLFVCLANGEVRLMESRDRSNVDQFRKLVQGCLCRGSRKERQLIHELQMPDYITETVFNNRVFVRHLEDGTIALREEPQCPTSA